MVLGGEGDCEGEGGGSSSEGGDSPFGRRQFPRDSGCYEAGVGVGGVRVRTSPLVHRSDEPPTGHQNQLRRRNDLSDAANPMTLNATELNATQGQMRNEF